MSKKKSLIKPKVVTPEIVETKSTSSRSLATPDPVAMYLKEIGQYPLLTREQEHELATRYKETGDPEAAETLVKSNLRFVVKVAAEYSKFGSKLIDLIQEGNVGLMHAVKEFNPYKGTKLITYAVWWIRGYIHEYLMRQYSVVRIGTSKKQRKLFYKLQKELRKLEGLGHEPNYKLLETQLGVSEKEIKDMNQRMTQRDTSLDGKVSPDSQTSLLDLLVDDEQEDLSSQLERSQEISILLKNIEKIKPQLNEKELFILQNRLLASPPMKLQEIGDKYKTSREAVRQMESRILKKIKKLYKESIGLTDET